MCWLRSSSSCDGLSGPSLGLTIEDQGLVFLAVYHTHPAWALAFLDSRLSKRGGSWAVGCCYLGLLLHVSHKLGAYALHDLAVDQVDDFSLDVMLNAVG